MTDSETLGTIYGSTILNIGALAFNPFLPFPESIQSLSHVTPFFEKISRESCKNWGLVEDPKTVAWWDTQSEEAKEEAFGGIRDLKAVMSDYRDWILAYAPNTDDTNGARPMAHGSVFDVVLQEAAFRATNVPCPWPYNGALDTRTVFWLSGVNYKGVHHKALHDCAGQIEAINHGIVTKLGLTAAPVAEKFACVDPNTLFVQRDGVSVVKAQNTAA